MTLFSQISPVSPSSKLNELKEIQSSGSWWNRKICENS